MIDEQIAPLLYAQYRLLWPLSPEARRHMINEIRLDYIFEAQLELVAAEMEDSSHVNH